MLDASNYFQNLAFDNRRVQAPTVSNEYENAVGAELATNAVPTLPVGASGVRYAYKGGPLGDSDKAVGAVGFTHVVPADAGPITASAYPRLVLPPYDGLPFAVKPPEDAGNYEIRELAFVGMTEWLVLDEPEVEGTNQYLVEIRIPVVYWRKDLAEIIHAITSWHVDDAVTTPVANARAQLSYSSLIAFSARMNDPRFRQVHTVWTKDGETVGQFVERCLSGSDALAFWGGYDENGDPVLGFGLVSARAGDTLPYSINETAADPGRTAFLIGELRVEYADTRMINNYRRVIGSLVSQANKAGTGFMTQISSDLVTEALDGDINVLTFKDAASQAAFGDAPVEEVFETLADARSAVGDFRIETMSTPVPAIVFAMGPLGLDFFCGERFTVDAPAKGISTDQVWRVEEQTIDFNVFTVSVQAVEVTAAEPSYDPDELDDVLLWMRSDAGLTINADLVSVDEWADQSGNGNDAVSTASHSAPRITGVNLGGAPTLRFYRHSYGALVVPTLSADVDEEASLLVVAMVRMFEDNQEPRPLISTQGANHTNAYCFDNGALGPSPRYRVREEPDSNDAVTISIGVDKVRWREIDGYANPFIAQPAPPTAITLTPTTTTRETAFGLPVNAWKVVVVELYRSALIRQSANITYAYQANQKQSYVAIYNAVTGALENADHHRQYGADNRGHAIARAFAIGVEYTGAPSGPPDYDSMDLAELAVFKRSTDQLPWSPDQIEGLVANIRARWGFS